MTALATAGELETHLQRTFDPVQAQQALDLAAGAVIAYCGWPIAEETTTLYGEGDGSVVLTLPTLRLTAVTDVRIGFTSITIGPESVSWSRRGQLFRPTGWPAFTLIEVDCTHGFNPIPDVIKLVTLELAARTMSNPQALVSSTTGQVTRNYGSGPKLSALDERLLAQYSL
jgi:hypothetical protein